MVMNRNKDGTCRSIYPNLHEGARRLVCVKDKRGRGKSNPGFEPPRGFVGNLAFHVKKKWKCASRHSSYLRPSAWTRRDFRLSDTSTTLMLVRAESFCDAIEQSFLAELIAHGRGWGRWAGERIKPSPRPKSGFKVWTSRRPCRCKNCYRDRHRTPPTSICWT